MSLHLFNFFLHIFPGNYGGVRLPVHREAVQDLQGPEIPVHADGVLPGGRALDHPQVHRVLHCKKDPIYVFPEMKLRGLLPNFHIHVSLRDEGQAVISHVFADHTAIKIF